MIDPSRPAPLRLVDASDGTWLLRVDGSGGPGRAPSTPELAGAVYVDEHAGEVLPFPELYGRRGPLRAVVPVEACDVGRLRDLVRQVGAKSLATIAAALYQVEKLYGARPPEPTASGVRRDLLTAGRPSSWESGVLLDLVWRVGPAVSRQRLDPELLEWGRVIFARWVRCPSGYVEVAGTLAAVLGPVVGESGEFSAVADGELVGDERLRGWACSRAGDGLDGWPRNG
ncbi:hypothetical protein [Actinomadura sp. K4S16]|uniref:hypothetical protein n=1 Tax=Actinomadura sp. K4S16 TaxID=1316147 RepID=UPI0011EF12C7|nr:hypothetical protein [Actinomadura sp. K4S16]